MEREDRAIATETEKGTDTETGAEALLRGLRAAGVTYLFANSGTDFPPVIEALAGAGTDALPTPVLVPHESAGVAMAHGHYLASGQPQAVMVHVNVGLANAAMGLMNAASDEVPIILLSGRTPITEGLRPGGRVSPIQYGQEMYDQHAIVREAVKFDYEMRYPDQGRMLATRAVTLAMSAPRAPVYLSLPREPLMEAAPRHDPPPQRPAALPHPDPEALAVLAEWLGSARAPLAIVQRGDPEGRLGAALDSFARRFGVAVVEPYGQRNLLAGDHPCWLGEQPAPALAEADLVLVLDAPVPWVEGRTGPAPGARVVHVGPDPAFARMPVRSHRSDLGLVADPAAALTALAALLGAPGPAARARADALARRSAARRAKHREAAFAARGDDGTAMGTAWFCHCLSEVMEADTLLFSELGVSPGAMCPPGPNTLFCNTHSGGLGWGLPAALGAQMACPERLVIAAVGDGSYIFANPVACHQIAEALHLPVLTVIKNNGMWNAVRRLTRAEYPGGAAARANRMPLVSLDPAPDYTMVAAASRAHVERVTRGADLPDALARALAVIRHERRQALLDVTVAAEDGF